LNILQREETLTLADEGLDATLKRIKMIIHKVLPAHGAPATGIGISAPGPLNPKTGVVVSPPNLPGWHNVPLGDILYDEFKIPVFVGNDANVAALAETARGAALGCHHVVFLTISTGIGSGMIVDGRMLLGSEGLGAEAGHIVMIAEEGKVSTLEKEAAGPALARQAKARIEQGEVSLIKELVQGDLSRIAGSTVGEAAAKGDKLALEVVRRAGTIVGLGIVSLLHLFNPEIVVIGGGVSKLGDLLFAPMREAIQRYAIDAAYWQNLRIERAALGEDVSIVGAAALVITQGGQANVREVVRKLDI
jgi:glucokinase